MSTLALVDLGITGIYIAVSGRTDIIMADLAANVAILGAANAAGAWFLYRPIDQALRRQVRLATVARRINSLPRLATQWTAFITLSYCGVTFSLGVYMPATADLDAIPDTIVIASLCWFVFLYVLYYGFYIYFLISDFTNDLRSALFLRARVLPASKGRVLHRLLVIFGVISLVPTALVILDLTVFADLRRAQGLSVTQTIFLDLFVSVFLILVSLVFVTRSLVRPVHSLAIAIDKSKKGDLEVRAPVISSDELGLLSERFNEMIEGLRERQFIRQTFGRYVPDEITELLLKNKGVVQPRVTTATILYADIENFTGISENRSAQSVLEMLNEFFGVVVEAVKQTGGVVNQFHGDAMLVTFNVPVSDPGHADNAMRAAMEIQRLVAEKTFSGIRLRVRIGISTGPVVAGAVGGENRLSYTVYGDTVNLAARLERLNKKLGTYVLVSSTTVRSLRNTYPLVARGRATVKGKQNPIDVFALQQGYDGVANSA